jgi:hypothetical protein
LSDVADRPRRFAVYLDKRLAGCDPIAVVVDVAAGEDADEICGETLDSLIENELYTGWSEVE